MIDWRSFQAGMALGIPLGAVLVFLLAWPVK